MGKTDIVQHNIQLKENTQPVYIPAYRMPHSRKAIVESLVSHMLQQGVIEPSVSPFNSSMFLVPKSHGEWRAVVNFRALNKVAFPPRYPMPVLEEILQSLVDNNSVFSTLDSYSGFYQIDLSPESREMTTFTTPSGHCQYKRMFMGLVGSPSTF